MTAGLVVRPRSFYGRIVLGHVKVIGPGSQRTCHRLQRIVQRLTARPVEPFGQQSILGRVVPEREQQRVRHIGLEAERLRPIHLFEQFQIPFPAVHAAPADFSLCREPFAELLRHRARLAKGCGNLLGVAGRIFRPLRRARRGVDPDDAGLADARRTKRCADLTRLPDLRHELTAFVGVAHRRAAAGRRPHRRDQRPHEQLPRADPVHEPLQVVVARVDAHMRIEQKQVHAVELHAVDRRVRGEVQHRVEIDRRL